MPNMSPDTVSAIAASVSAFAAAGAVAFASLQVRYLRKQIAQDYDWKRREKALLFSQVHHPDVRAARARLGGKLGGAQTTIPWDQLKAKIDADQTIHDDLRTILIYIENIGLAVRYDVADFSMIYDLNGTDIILFCEIYRAYIDQTKGGNPRIWNNVDSLLSRLTRESKRQAECGAPPPP